MNGRKLIPISFLFLGIAAACGGPSDPVLADLQLIERQEATITVTPALEVTSLLDEHLASRIVIDEIELNLTEVRLLGADPSIPAGGLDLLAAPRVIRADETVEAAVELPFPEQFLGDDDLAVYLRIDRSSDLEQASLVVRGRLYASPVSGSHALTALNTTGATDPDVDPADEDEGNPVGATDPDVDPADDPGIDCATDPDVDPADCTGMTRHKLISREMANPSVSFELRDRGAADLVSQLDDAASLDVVIGIPANHWFTDTVLAHLEQALVETAVGVVNEEGPVTRTDDAVIVEAQQAANPRGGPCGAAAGPDGCRNEVFLTDVREGLKVHR